MAELRFLVTARNRAVGVEDGHIIEPEGAFDIVLDFPDADVRPGLINAHDHLHRNHYGRLGQPPYPNAYSWARDIQARYRTRIAEGRGKPRREALIEGAWKNLFAGVTTVIHHDSWEADFDRDFPLHVPRVRNADSLGMTSEPGAIASDGCFCLHLAEGIDTDAAEEVRTLDAKGLLTTKLIAVHGVGMDQDGIERFRSAGAALIWCPSSNVFLFGRTAPAPLLSEGLDVLIGSDSLLTGAGNLLDELRYARMLGLLSDERLEDAVGLVAARRFGLPAPALDPGAVADLIVLSKPLLEARAEDVALVMVGGAPRIAKAELVSKLKELAACGKEMKVGSVVRWTNIDGFNASKGKPS